MTIALFYNVHVLYMPCTACGQGATGMSGVTKPKALLLGGARRRSAPLNKYKGRVIYVRTAQGIKRYYVR